jgi:branched-chain amino acid transport system substrate-binding protein
VALGAIGAQLLVAGCRGEVPTDAGPSGRSAALSPNATVPVKVAFLQTLGGDEVDHRAVTAYQAAALAFSNAAFAGDLPVSVELAAYDTGGDASTASTIIGELAADPSVVAAIGAPDLAGQGALGDALAAAGVPWVSLSGLGSRLGERGWTGWRRLVADQAAQGSVLGEAVDRVPGVDTVCAMGDGTPASRSLLRAAVDVADAEVVLRAAVGEAQPDVTTAARALVGSGCTTVIWAGEGSTAGALRRQLVEEGALPTFVGGDRMRDQTFIEVAGPAAEGAFATCPCVDVSTSADLAAQRFIQDFQAEYGLPPGPYAVEAWDAARLLLTTFRDGATTRAETLAAVGSVRVYEGLAGTYRFAGGGDVIAPIALVRLYEVAGGRWLEVGLPA